MKKDEQGILSYCIEEDCPGQSANVPRRIFRYADSALAKCSSDRSETILLNKPPSFRPCYEATQKNASQLRPVEIQACPKSQAKLFQAPKAIPAWDGITRHSTTGYGHPHVPSSQIRISPKNFHWDSIHHRSIVLVSPEHMIVVSWMSVLYSLPTGTAKCWTFASIPIKGSKFCLAVRWRILSLSIHFCSFAVIWQAVVTWRSNACIKRQIHHLHGLVVSIGSMGNVT